ncbi:uncharacterized protein N7496_003103 [Penicillium cataractarum]|uniref:Transcription factor domain-containing protein n=1 Tax=Penicillium cataractarum TaxID=2100454 RepID=A0A9W9SLN7_9EURO|nr:uncharacterized protein N7496_003103 [Penicillium cataractarum]KAJ5380675.1 hypothetical protein N7496_003103 [Penicillium cataractarum]
MSLIQELRDNITIQEQSYDIYDVSEDIIINGIISDDLARELLKGFSNMSNRWLFMTTDPENLRARSPLLFGACVLAGLHVNSTLHGSPTHYALYRHVHGLLGRSHLVSHSSLDTVQSMLIFSMWDLRPMRDSDHGNSWLLSGTAAMQLMLTTPFDDLLITTEGVEKQRAREVIRTWNLICLCQLQFSVGSGRPPVIAEQYLEQCAKVLEFPSYNARDGLVLAGIQLYRVLWSLTSSNSIQTVEPTWPEIDNLRKSQEGIYNLDSSEPLRFAYSCAYLILARQTLQHLSESPCEDDKNDTPFIIFAISQSRKILEYFLSLSELTSYVHPSYENLLCSFAMVTLAEFVACVGNIGEVIVLMDRAISHIQRGGKAEPVSRWALNTVRQHLSGEPDQGRLTSNEIQNIGQYLLPQETTTRPWEDAYWEQEFPSLEEMFFANVM